MKPKTILKTALALIIVALIAMPILRNIIYDQKDGILSLYFVAATTRDNYRLNCLDQGWNPDLGYGKKYVDDKYRLKSKDALQLIEEIKAIPETKSEGDDLAYVIKLKYQVDGEIYDIERIGYDVLPENWKAIVRLTNQVFDTYISDGEEVVRIDEEHMKENFADLSDLLPENLTVGDVIKSIPITYEVLYGPDSKNPENLINVYLYDYLDMKSHEIMQIDPTPSTEEEFYAFAEERLDEIEKKSPNEIEGKYKGIRVRIIPFDELENWIAERDGREIRFDPDGARYQYEKDAGFEGVMERDGGYLIADSSRKFVILYSHDFEMIDLYNLIK